MGANELGTARASGLILRGLIAMIDLAEGLLHFGDEGVFLADKAALDALEDEKTSLPEAVWVIVIEDLLAGFDPVLFGHFCFVDFFIKRMNRFLELLVRHWTFGRAVRCTTFRSRGGGDCGVAQVSCSP